jgi:UDP-N-acetylmuramoyl-tripeptide--D-alanyl-D-alanine ligase
MKLSSLEISQAVRAIHSQASDGIVPTGYFIDSRTLQSGECFIAIRGRNFDGYQFISEALSRGASLIVAQAEAKGTWSTEAPVLFVEDTLVALQQLANHARRKWGKKVIAITGSIGKTTTKEIASIFLAARQGIQIGCNFNNDYGLPLSYETSRVEVSEF